MKKWAILYSFKNKNFKERFTKETTIEAENENEAQLKIRRINGEVKIRIEKLLEIK